MHCYLWTQSHFTSSESCVNISLSNLFSLLQTGTLTPSSLGFPDGDAFIDYRQLFWTLSLSVGLVFPFDSIQVLYLWLE